MKPSYTMKEHVFSSTVHRDAFPEQEMQMTSDGFTLMCTYTVFSEVGVRVVRNVLAKAGRVLHISPPITPAVYTLQSCIHNCQICLLSSGSLLVRYILIYIYTIYERQFAKGKERWIRIDKNRISNSKSKLEDTS